MSGSSMSDCDSHIVSEMILWLPLIHQIINVWNATILLKVNSYMIYGSHDYLFTIRIAQSSLCSTSLKDSGQRGNLARNEIH